MLAFTDARQLAVITLKEDITAIKETSLLCGKISDSYNRVLS